MRREELGSEKKKYELLPKKVWDKQKVEGRCMKFGSSKHQARDCKALSKAKTPLLPENAKLKLVQKRRQLDKEHRKIMELGSEENVGKEQAVHNL